MKKRIYSLILACCLTWTLFPLSATATEDPSAMSPAIGVPASDSAAPALDVPAPESAAPALDTVDASLQSLLEDYLNVILTTGTADYDDAELSRRIFHDALEGAILRVEELSEREITVTNADFTITGYQAETGDLTADVFETVDGETFVTTHEIRLSGNAESGWRIEADSCRDALLPDFVSINAGTDAPKPSTSHENDWKNTGNQAEDIVQIARTQLGYAETGDNYTKYNIWFYGYNQSAAWCAIFISWCAEQAGIPESVIARNARASGFSVSNMSLNRYGAPAYAFGAKAAKGGDIAFIDNSGNEVSNHVGLVYKADSEYIYTIEGNCANKVITRKYSAKTGRIGNSKVKIVFFARPNYVNGGKPISGPSELEIRLDRKAYQITRGDLCDVTGRVSSNYPLTKVSGELDTGWAVSVSDIGGRSLDIGSSKINDFRGADLPVGNHTLTITASDSSGKTVSESVSIEVSPSPVPVDTEPGMPPDVRRDKYYYDAVKWAVEHDIIIYSNRNFNPEEPCNRASAVTFLWRLAGAPAPSSYDNPFTDVVPVDSYYQAVLWAVERGITKGATDTTFSPDALCNRGQIVTFLHRFAGTPPGPNSNPFTDIARGRFCYDAVSWASALGVAQGYEDNSFKPTEMCKRAQIIAFLYRYATVEG